MSEPWQTISVIHWAAELIWLNCAGQEAVLSQTMMALARWNVCRHVSRTGSLHDILISPLQALAHLPTVSLTEMGAKNGRFRQIAFRCRFRNVSRGRDPGKGKPFALFRGTKLLAIGSSTPSRMPDNEKTDSSFKGFLLGFPLHDSIYDKKKSLRRTK
ncbi:MAG: hypothetical protein MZV70_73585 [Desulfobacterales bacterium]|nr:hypothetical protein [Desulfobacterales bacterium]